MKKKLKSDLQATPSKTSACRQRMKKITNQKKDVCGPVNRKVDMNPTEKLKEPEKR